jgi:hypothetical protein
VGIGFSQFDAKHEKSAILVDSHLQPALSLLSEHCLVRCAPQVGIPAADKANGEPSLLLCRHRFEHRLFPLP